jgi:hypothetical protein
MLTMVLSELRDTEPAHLRGPPLPNKKFFFFVFLIFISKGAIRAIKIRSLPSRIVREKANFRTDVPPKKTIF